MTKLDDYRLNLRGKLFKPLVVGGMGVDISTAELALEAARLGGIGHISDAMVPFVSDKRFGTTFQREKGEANRHLRVESGDVVPETVDIKWIPEVVYQAALNHSSATMDRKQPGAGLVFVNVMEKLNHGNPRETLAARLRGVMDGGIDGITLSAGLHTGTLKLVEDHPRFRDVLFGIIVSSARALKIFLRGSAKADRLPDYIIVEGPLAGGHLGFGEDWREHDLRNIVNEVIEFLRAEDLQIPVIPAGGVFTGNDAVSYLDMGASAVQVATRFTISRECGLPENVKQIYINSKEEDIEVNMTSPSGYPMRMLKSSPSLRSNIRPNCEALGYLLDGNGACSYRTAWNNTPVLENGRKAPVAEKMCICYHFMKYSCYTCGQNVYRLKNATFQLPNGRYYLPTAEEVFLDYMEGRNYVQEQERLVAVAGGR